MLGFVKSEEEKEDVRYENDKMVIKFQDEDGTEIEQAGALKLTTKCVEWTSKTKTVVTWRYEDFICFGESSDKNVSKGIPTPFVLAILKMVKTCASELFGFVYSAD